MPALTDAELLVLQFEEKWWRRGGAKDAAIRRRFRCEPARYYQQLNVLINRPEAEAMHPLLVHRLRAIRSARRKVG